MIIPRLSPRRLLILALALALSTAAIVYHSRDPRAPLARWAPAQSLIFVETIELSKLLEKLMNSKGWIEWGPPFGLPRESSTLMETVMGGLKTEDRDLLRWLGASRVMLAVTSLESAGDEIIPEFFLVIEPSGTLKPTDALDRLARLMVDRFDWQPSPAGTEKEVDQRVLRSRKSGKPIYVRAAHDALLVGNRPGALRLALDAFERRIDSLDQSDPYSQIHRALPRGQVLALLRAPALASVFQGAHWKTISAALSSRQAGPDEQGAERTGERFTIGYSGAFEDGVAVDRYLWLLDAESMQGMNKVLAPSKEIPDLLADLPPWAPSGMILRVGDSPGVWSHLRDYENAAAAHPFLRALALLVRQRASDWKVHLDDRLLSAVGPELLIVKLADENLVWVVPIRSEAPVAAALGRYFKGANLKPKTQNMGPFVLVSSDEPSSPAFALGQRVLLIGDAGALRMYIDRLDEDSWRRQNLLILRQNGQNVDHAFEVSISQDSGEAARAMLTIAQWLIRPAIMPARPLNPAKFPCTTRISKWTDHGIYCETRSPLGNMGTLLAAFEDETTPRIAW